VEGEWWAMRAAWADALCAGVQEAWTLLAPRVDVAVNAAKPADDGLARG
jgi:hypothetical protein